MLNKYYTGVLAALLVTTSLAGSPPWAQEATSAATTEASASTDGAAEVEDALYTAEELDTLLAPVALFPDSLVAQILYAATYPVDVVKAGRWVSDNPEMPPEERTDAVGATDWDPSVQALAVGFPDLVTRMNDHLDWTEQVGDAVLVQTDDVMDSVQRLRDQAAETGYLTTNDAQTVVVEGDTITIEPTDPNIVYVPAYNPEVVYTTPAPPDVVYVDSNNGTDFGDVLLTGAMVFGTAMIIDEIFDDDDPWDDYWRGPRHVHWDNHDFNPGPNVKVNGDVNIGSNNNRINNFNRKDVDIDRNRTNIDRNRTDIDRSRINAGNKRVGDLDRDAIDRNRGDVGFNPTDAKRNEARDKMAARKASGNKPAKLPATSGGAKRPADLKPAKVNKPVAAPKPANISKPKAAARPAKVSKPKAAKPAARKAPAKSSAFKQSGGSRAKAASSRGKSSNIKRRR